MFHFMIPLEVEFFSKFSCKYAEFMFQFSWVFVGGADAGINGNVFFVCMRVFVYVCVWKSLK